MRENKTYLKIVMLLAVIGVLVAGKLLSVHLRFSSGLAGLTESCGIGSGMGCADVAVSKYSVVLGIPLPALALGVYIAIIILGLYALKSQQGNAESLHVIFLLATLSVVVTVVMFAISNYVLKAFCPYCAMLWVVNLAIWPLMVLQLGRGWGDALSANLELLGGGKANLRKERVMASLMAVVACVVITSVVGVVAKANMGLPAGDGSILGDFDGAPIVMLPAEAYGGPTSKGFSGEGSPVMEIAELADFQCPACKMAGQLMRTFVLKNKDKVRITYHNFPLDGSCNPFAPNGGHRMACAAARGGLCAAKQDKFWPYHDQVFDRQEELSDSVLTEIAEKAGLDMEAYRGCLKDSATETALQKDMQYGEMIGLQSTPTLVINSRKLIGAKLPDELEALLRKLEAEQKK